MENAGVTDMTRGFYRRIYSGYITGQRINKLSLAAEAWFWRLNVTVDDFGNGRADPKHCRDVTAGNRRVTPKQIAGWLDEMQKAGLIDTYTVKGEHFLHIIDFEDNQPSGRNGRRLKRHPGPPGNPGESGKIRVNPGESGLILDSQESPAKPQQHNFGKSSGASSAPHPHPHPHNQIHTHNQIQIHPHPHTESVSVTQTKGKAATATGGSEFSKPQWKKYIASHPGIRNPETFLKSALTGKHDYNMEAWLEQTNGTNSENNRSDPGIDFEFRPKSVTR